MEEAAIDLSPSPGASDPPRSATNADHRRTPQHRSSVRPHVATGSVGVGSPPTPPLAGENVSSAGEHVVGLEAAGENAEVSSIEERPLGLWRAARIHRRAFNRRTGSRVASALTLFTSSCRVERPNAVAS